MNNNILRTEKVKSRAQITLAAEHNFRLRTQSNINSNRTHLNKILVNTLGVNTKKSTDLQNKLTDFYSSIGVKEKKDNVLMLEFVVSASPEFFTGKSDEKIYEWANHQVDFFKKEFDNQLKIAVLHLDEKTPHLHFMIGTEIKSVKKYKNRYGVSEKETWSLNAKRYNPEFLIGLHDRHALWNKKYELKRGAKKSMRKHTSLKEFYAVVDKALNTDYDKTIEKTIDSLETSFLSNKVSIDEIREKFKPMLNKLLKQNKALKQKFALDIKQWANDLNAKETQLENEKLEIERKELELDDRKEYYVEAINTKIADGKLIAAQAKELKTLREENKRLKDTYEQKQENSIQQPYSVKTNKL